MPYNILHYNTTPLTTIPDGFSDTTTSLTLAGPNFVGYGQSLNENLVYLLENFAGTLAPSNSLAGQLWFNSDTQTLQVYTTQGYYSVGGGTQVGTSVPALQRTGDTWYNNSTNQLYLYDGAQYQLVGPIYTKQQGVSGAIPVQISDGTANHNVLQLQYGGTVYAMISGDVAFTPSPTVAGFGSIHPGLTFNSSIANPTINTNITGNLTGNVAGSLVGVSVVATNLYGNLTGNVTGNLTGNVTASTLLGSLTGNVTSLYAVATNFSSGNAVITGGSITGDTSGTFVTLQATNFSSGNVQVVGGSATGLTNLTSTVGQVVNFSSGNILVTGGAINSLSNISATTATLTTTVVGTEAVANFSTANAQITGGNATGLGQVSAGTAQFNNISTGNALITNGNVRLTQFTTAYANVTVGLTTTNAQILGGNVSNTLGRNNTFDSSNITNSTATTPVYNDNSTNIATTAFVQAVMPQGVIVMWGGPIANIPAGWALCNGVQNAPGPDLTSRFVIGASSTGYTPGTTGGASSVGLTANNIPSHSHTVSLSGNTGSAGGHVHSASSSVSDPGHHHEDPYAEGGVPFPQVPNTWGAAGSSATDGDQTRYYTGTAQTGISVSTSVSAATDHQHTVSLVGNTGSYGSGVAFSTLPPYYALCYIQKMY
jgi:hypothetical protein